VKTDEAARHIRLRDWVYFWRFYRALLCQPFFMAFVVLGFFYNWIVAFTFPIIYPPVLFSSHRRFNKAVQRANLSSDWKGWRQW